MSYKQSTDPFCNFTPDVIDMFHRARTLCNIELETENENPKYMHGRDLTQHIRAKLMSHLNRAALSQADVDICNKMVKGFFLHGNVYLYFRKTNGPVEIGRSIHDEPKTIRQLRQSFESYQDTEDSTALEPLFRNIRAELAATGMEWPVTHLYPLRVDFLIHSRKISEIYFSDQMEGRVTRSLSLNKLRRSTESEPKLSQFALTLRRKDKGEDKEAQ